MGKAPLIISVADTSRLYGTENPEFRIVYEGFVNGEGPEVLTAEPVVATEATAETGVGTYAITLSGAAADNYEIEYRLGQLTIEPLKTSLVITPHRHDGLWCRTHRVAGRSLRRMAGGEYAYAVADTSVARLSGDMIHILSAGTTWIKVSQQESENYGAATDSVALVVKKALLSVSVSDTIRLYKEENPVFEILYSGFVNGDTLSALSELPTAHTTAVADSDPGEYPITLSGGVADNYELVYVDGAMLTVDKLTPVINGDSIRVVYGSEPVALTSTNPDGELHALVDNDAVAAFAEGSVVIKGAGKTVLSAFYQDESAYYHASDT